MTREPTIDDVIAELDLSRLITREVTDEDATVRKLMALRGLTRRRAESALEHLVRDGRAVRERAYDPIAGRQCWAYRLIDAPRT